VSALVALRDTTSAEFLMMATRKGFVKKTALSEYATVRRAGLIAIALRKGDELAWVAACAKEDRVILATRKGKGISFKASDARPMGRSTQGVTGIRLKKGDEIVGMGIARQRTEVLSVTENGYGKRTSIDEFPTQGRGGQGVILASLGAKTGDLQYNNAIPILMGQLLPNGVLGIAVTGLLAAFMAGMAANISAFNTVFSYDIWQDYVAKDRPDGYYIAVGRIATVAAAILAIFTALIAAGYSNLMDYLQTLFGFFNAPLFATFILGMFWKRMTSTAGWAGLVAGTLSAVFVFILGKSGVIDLPGQGVPFIAASAAFVVDIIVSVAVTTVTTPKPAAELAGLVYSETPREAFSDPESAGKAWYYRPVPLAAVALTLTIILNVVFH